MAASLSRLLTLEFVAWFIWLGLFALLQRRLCRRYPGIRSMCRNAFLATMVVAVLPGIWILTETPHGGLHLVRLVNRYFGIGVYAQTSLRALIQLNWLALAPHRFALTPPRPALTLTEERQLLAMMVALPKILRGGKAEEPPTPPGSSRP
jgi:hypothetical protein